MALSRYARFQRIVRKRPRQTMAAAATLEPQVEGQQTLPQRTKAGMPLREPFATSPPFARLRRLGSVRRLVVGPDWCFGTWVSWLPIAQRICMAICSLLDEVNTESVNHAGRHGRTFRNACRGARMVGACGHSARLSDAVACTEMGGRHT